jgi:serine protease Do
MSPSATPAQKSRFFSPRRLILLAGVASLGAAVLFTAPGFVPKSGLPTMNGAALAQDALPQQRPVGFADIVEKVKPAVISVRVKIDGGARMSFDTAPTQRGAPMDRFFRRLPDSAVPDELRRAPNRNLVTGQGSGFFITSDGFAVTNNHVVDKAETVEVATDDGKTYSAKVIGTDPRTDVALIKVDGRNDFPHVAFSEKSPRIGDWVLAVGNPFGLGGTVTAGIVSARGRDIGAGPYDDFIQIDAPVNRGNSGGPTFDVDGSVIGVNTAIFSPSGGSVGIAFAIPADTVKSVVTQLKEKGVVSRGWIGVQIQPVTADIAEGLGLKSMQGALVAEPQADGPAVKAGIAAGDVITAVNGNSVKDARDLARQVGAMAPGVRARLTVVQKGQEKMVQVTLGELPNQREARATPETREPSGQAMPRLGLTLAPAAEVSGSGSDGVVVTAVDPDSLAAEHGFKTGDVILEAGGRKVASPTDIRNVIGDAQKDGKRTVMLRVKSGESTKYLALRLSRA